ncbi:MAG: hypothetical protein AAB815_02165 [Patescibacteria group bacterium]
MSSDISKYFDKNNLHHAYLIEGARAEIVPQILDLLKECGVAVTGNPDFLHITLDSFKIEDARNLKSFSVERGISENKKIFIISANNFLLEAQNTLLKMFEEPIEDTHFFLIVPDTDALLPTLVSRFYLIPARQDLAEGLKDAEKFVAMPIPQRLDFIKELISETENEEEAEMIVLDSARAKALKFLNSLEVVLHKKFIPRVPLDRVDFFNQIFKVREFLRQPGSSIKSLMESVALTIPNL